MADLEDTDYRRLLCVETTNAANDVREIAPGGECRLTANYRVIRD
jgi:glucose-6-phosphate 1-epimerase